ncbi:MAG: Holliday junction resolvase RuvX [Candidatus Hydrogenedentota bacterium]
MAEQGRIMGLDVGEVRTGVAMSDPLGMFASPHATVPMSGKEPAAVVLGRMAAELGVVRVVSGLPLDQNGEVGPQAQRVLDFLEQLRARVDIPVETVDERFSTVAAERMLISSGMRRKGRKRVVDQVAAAHILQLYLDQRASAQRNKEQPGS